MKSSILLSLCLLSWCFACSNGGKTQTNLDAATGEVAETVADDALGRADLEVTAEVPVPVDMVDAAELKSPDDLVDAAELETPDAAVETADAPVPPDVPKPLDLVSETTECGDGECGEDEDPCTCPEDCLTGNGDLGDPCCADDDCIPPPCGPCCVMECVDFECVHGEVPPECCGNGECEKGETAVSCPEDCMALVDAGCCLTDADCNPDADADGDYEKLCVGYGLGAVDDWGVCTIDPYAVGPQVLGPYWCWDDSDCLPEEYCHGTAICGCLLNCDMVYEGPGFCAPKETECVPVQEFWVQEYCDAASLVIFDGEQCLQTCPGCCWCGPFCDFTFDTIEECEASCVVPPQCEVFEGECDGAIPPEPWWFFDGHQCLMEDTCMCENCPGTYVSKFECDTACLAGQCIKWGGACDDAEPDQPWWYFDGVECKEEANCSCENCAGVFLTKAQCAATCLPQPECAIWDGMCEDVDTAPWWFFDGIECKLQDSCQPDPTQQYDTQEECEAACVDLPCKLWQGLCVDPEPDGEWWLFNGTECEQGLCGCVGCPTTYLTEAQCKESCGL